MTSPRVRYELEDSVATIVMDDGKRNVVSPDMLRELHAALDRAEQDRAVVVLTGRQDVLSAGFDLNILKTGVLDALSMILGGFELSARILAFPTPVVIACNGHAIAMGAFLLLSGDYCLGARGPFKIVANEVAIGLTLPYSAIEICRQRLAPAHFVRATLLSETYSPETAVDAGFLDRVVPAEDLLSEAATLARQLAQLDMKAHHQTKLRIRRQLLKGLKRAIRADGLDLVKKGVGRMTRSLRSR